MSIGPNVSGYSLPARYITTLLLVGMSLAVLYVVNTSVLSSPRSGGHAGGLGGNPVAATPAVVPPVSDRHFRSGSAHGVSTGSVPFDFTLPVDIDQAYAKAGLAWIAFGAPGEPRALLVTFDEPANSVALSQAGMTALGTDGQCVFDVTVTPSEVQGHIACEQADGLRDGVKVGTVSIEVDFTAGS